jgi:hypothetical protein
MTLVGTHASRDKTDLYRRGVDQEHLGSARPGSEPYFCLGLAAVGAPWLVAHQAALSAAPGPFGTGGTLYQFMVGRFQATYEMQLPVPGVVSTCDQATGIADPLG